MAISWRVRVSAVGLLGWMLVPSGPAIAGEPPKVTHTIVYREAGRFGGWPANHGMWAWGDEILVGFSRGFYKDRGRYHHINKEKPEEFLLAQPRRRIELVGGTAAPGGRPDRHGGHATRTGAPRKLRRAADGPARPD